MSSSTLRARSATIWAGPPKPTAPTGRTIHLGPLLIGLLMVYIFIWPPQARETFLWIVADGHWLHGMLGLVGVLWLSAALFAWNATLAGARIDRIYDDRPSYPVDRWLKDVRDLKAALAASMPLLAVTYGLVAAAPGLEIGAAKVATVDKALAGSISALPFGLLVAGGVFGIVSCVWLQMLVMMVRPRHIRRIQAASMLAGGIVYALPVLLTNAMPGSGEDVLITTARTLGPIAVTALIGITLVPTLTVLAWLTRHVLFERCFVPLVSGATRLVGAKWLTLVVAGSMIFLLYTNTLSLRGNGDLEGIFRPARLDAPDKRGIGDDFEDWLRRRGIVAGQPVPEKPYPVFVVAAQGGGIYAASAAMTLLAGLQDECSNFAEHVFAISAVSGGAIGASAFHGLAGSPERARPCGAKPAAPIGEAASAIATDDYISPLLLVTPVDWATKVPVLAYRLASGIASSVWHGAIRLTNLAGAGKAASADQGADRVLGVLEGSQTRLRAGILRRSFLASYRTRSTGQMGTGLAGTLSTHWRGDLLEHGAQSPGCGKALESCRPALVLGATMVETGHRVAFSPFSLIGAGDGTLHSYRDLVRQLALSNRSAREYGDLDIIGAAVTSARFPFVLPAWPLEHKGLKSSPTPTIDGRLNSVDGGYTDGTGATTAVDILEQLRAQAAERKLLAYVDFRLVLLTDSETSVDIAREQGTVWPDIVAPTLALLESRKLLATTAISKAKKQIRDNFAKPAAGGETLIEIRLDHRIFQLPLGWLLSQHTNRIMKLMLGNPERCKPAPAAPPSEKIELTDLVRENSCAQKAILDLLR